MKNTILMLCILLTTALTFSQNKGSIKIDVSLQKKIKSTPVGFIENGKSKANLKKLNTEICSGAKITSFEIKKSDDSKTFYLIRKAKLKKGYLSNFIRLKKIGNELFVNFDAESFMAGCYSTTCQTCGEALSQTGMAFCECETTGGDCEEYDHCPDSEVLSSLFN